MRVLESLRPLTFPGGGGGTPGRGSYRTRGGQGGLKPLPHGGVGGKKACVLTY